MSRSFVSSLNECTSRSVFRLTWNNFKQAFLLIARAVEISGISQQEREKLAEAEGSKQLSRLHKPRRKT